jgi:hypothetical protein
MGQQPPSVLLSSQTHDRQAAALRKNASPTVLEPWDRLLRFRYALSTSRS